MSPCIFERRAAKGPPALYLPPASGVLPPKVLQVDHRQPLDHGLSGIQRLQTHNEGRDSRATICRIKVKYSNQVRNKL